MFHDSSKSTSRFAASGAKQRPRRINIIKAMKALAASAVVTLPITVANIEAVRAYTWHSTPQNAENLEAYNNFRNVRLTNATLQSLICFKYNLALIALSDGCDFMMQQSEFWQPSPFYFRFLGCDPNDQGRYIENLYLALNDPNAGNPGTASDQATGERYSPTNPSPPQITKDIFLCNDTATWDPGSTSLPLGFGGASVDDNAVFIFQAGSRSSNPAQYGDTNSSVQVMRTGNMSQPLSFNLQVGGTATPGTDYDWRDQTNPNQPAPNTNIGQVNFLSSTEAAARGQSPNFNNFFLFAIPQRTDRPERLITVTANSIPAGYKLGTTPTVVHVLEPVSIAKLTLTNQGQSTNLRYGSNPGFTITRRDGDLSQPLTVGYTVAGTASNGTDYNFLDGSITIPAGQTSVTTPLNVNNPGGAQPIPAKDIQITLDPDGQNDTVYQSQSPTLALTIPAYNPAQLGVGVSNGGTAGRGETSEFTVGRDPNGDLSQLLTVNYELGGTAQPGTDYRTSTSGRTGSLTIPAGEATASVPVTVPQETGSQAQPAQDITLTLRPGDGYALPDPAPSGTLTIPAYDPAAVQISNGPDGFSFTRPQAGSDQPLTINYELSGTAAPGTDYRVPGGPRGSITIPAGETTAALPVDVLPNSGTQMEPEETIIVSLRPGAGYDSAATQPSTITIPAYTPLSGGTGTNPPTFTVSRPGGSDLSQPLEIPYQVTGGTGTAGEDYGMPTSGTITIPAGSTVGALPIQVQPGARPGETVGITMTPPPGFGMTNATPTYTIGAGDIARNPDVPLSGTMQPDGGVLITRPESDAGNALDLPYTATVQRPDGSTDVRNGNVRFEPGQTQSSVPGSSLDLGNDGGTVAYDMRPPQGYQLDDSSLNGNVAARDNNDVPVVGIGTNNGGPRAGSGSGSGNGSTGSNSGSGNGSNPPGVRPGSGDQTWTNPSFTINRRPGTDLNEPVVVRYEVGGTAVPGVDYELLPGRIQIPAGQNSAQGQIRLLRDPSQMAGRTISIRLLDDPSYDVAQGQDRGDISLPNVRPTRPSGNGDSNGDEEPVVVTGSIDDGGDDDGDSSGGGGTGTAAAAIGGIGAVGAGVAAASGAFGGPNLLASTCPANYSLPAQVQHLARQVDSEGEIDWEEITFSALPAVNNRPAAQAFTLGDFGDELGKLSLQDVARITGEDLSGMTLSSLLGLSPEARLSDVPGLAEYIAESDGAANKQAQARPAAPAARPQVATTTSVSGEMALSALLSQRPALRNATLSQIPGVMEMELRSIANWQQIPVSQVPGLAAAPFDELFPCLNRPVRNRAEGNWDSSQQGRSSSNGDSGDSAQ